MPDEPSNGDKFVTWKDMEANRRLETWLIVVAAGSVGLSIFIMLWFLFGLSVDLHMMEDREHDRCEYMWEVFLRIDNQQRLTGLERVPTPPACDYADPIRRSMPSPLE